MQDSFKKDMQILARTPWPPEGGLRIVLNPKGGNPDGAEAPQGELPEGGESPLPDIVIRFMLTALSTSSEQATNPDRPRRALPAAIALQTQAGNPAQGSRPVSLRGGSRGFVR